MDHEITTEGDGRKVVYATCAISDISHDQGLDSAELFQDVRDGASKNQESFWKLQRDY
jgi:hypothetical protein